MSQESFVLVKDLNFNDANVQAKAGDVLVFTPPERLVIYRAGDIIGRIGFHRVSLDGLVLSGIILTEKKAKALGSVITPDPADEETGGLTPQPPPPPPTPKKAEEPKVETVEQSATTDPAPETTVGDGDDDKPAGDPETDKPADVKVEEPKAPEVKADKPAAKPAKAAEPAKKPKK